MPEDHNWFRLELLLTGRSAIAHVSAGTGHLTLPTARAAVQEWFDVLGTAPAAAERWRTGVPARMVLRQLPLIHCIGVYRHQDDVTATLRDIVETVCGITGTKSPIMNDL